MANTVNVDIGRSSERQLGSSIIGPAIVSVGFFVISLVIGIVFGGAVYSSPFGDDADIGKFYADNGTLIQFTGFFQVASAVALAVFTGAVCARIRAVSPQYSSLTYTAAIGGGLASLLLLINGLVQWSLSHPSVSENPEVRRAMHYLFFAMGGFAHVAAVGLLVGGVSLAALRARLVPRWFGVVSLIVSAFALLSTLTMVTESATALIPLGRFPTLVWLVAVGFILPRNRSTT